MSAKFHANDHQLPLKIPKFKKISYRTCDGCLHEELGMLFHKWCGEFKIITVQMHLNASDYSLKFHVSESQLPYTTTSWLTLNLKTFSWIQP